jgi:hypothetical protein
LPAARRERGLERRSFRAPRIGPTERAKSPKCAAERVATTTNAEVESVACRLREDGQFGPRRQRREDHLRAPLWSPRFLRFTSCGQWHAVPESGRPQGSPRGAP